MAHGQYDGTDRQTRLTTIILTNRIYQYVGMAHPFNINNNRLISLFLREDHMEDLTQPQEAYGQN